MNMKSLEERKLERLNEPQQVYIIESQENDRFSISAAALRQAKTFVALLENLSPELFKENPIHLETISTATLERVVEWIEYHKHDGPVVDLGGARQQVAVIPEWDSQFLAKLSNGELFDLLCAATYLDIHRLLHYGCKAVANMASGKSSEELRVLFGIKSDEEVAEDALYAPGPSNR